MATNHLTGGLNPRSPLQLTNHLIMASNHLSGGTLDPTSEEAWPLPSWGPGRGFLVNFKLVALIVKLHELNF